MIACQPASSSFSLESFPSLPASSHLTRPVDSSPDDSGFPSLPLHDKRDDNKAGTHLATAAAGFDGRPSPRGFSDLTPMSGLSLDERQRFVDRETTNIFLFVNPASGGNSASRFLTSGIEFIRLTLETPINLWVWNIQTGLSGRKPGFLKLKEVVERLKAEDEAECLAERNSLLGAVERGAAQHQPGKYKRNKLVHVIVAGGDGTVMWCLSELTHHEVDGERIVVGMVPYGTGKASGGN